MTAHDEPTGDRRPALLYIAGLGHSGSTLVDIVLGSLDGFVSTGELFALWGRYLRGKLCGCRRRVDQCPFWSAVIEEGFPGITRREIQQIVQLSRRVDRWWRIPSVTLWPASVRRSGDLATYLRIQRRIYTAIGAVSQADVIVESSKWPARPYFMTLLTDTIQPSVLHLVRDSRGVAHSFQRRVWDPVEEGWRETLGTTSASIFWMAVNTLLSPLQNGSIPYRMVRYEDFVTDPRAQTSKILRFLGRDDAENPFNRGAQVEFPENHCVFGNSLRFERGVVNVHMDEEWRTAMPAGRRALASALTWPLLLKYGYLRRPL